MLKGRHDMPDALTLKPEDLDTIEKRRKFTIAVVGCGERGINYSLAFAEAGFNVICTDADQSIVKSLSKGKIPFSDRAIETKLKSYMRKDILNFTSETKTTVTQSSIILLTVPVKIDDKKNSDYVEIQSSCKQIGVALQRGELVVYGGVASFGLMEGVIKETLENTSGLKAGEDFGLAYNPLLIFDDINPKEAFGNKELLVAANDQNSLDAATSVLATLTKKGIKQIRDVKTAELATLFAVARRDVNVALSNEFAMLCEDAGVDISQTLELATRDFREVDWAPTVAEEPWRDELYLLQDTAENLEVKLRVTTAGRQTNENMARHAVGLVQDALRSAGKTLRRARVTVLGTARRRPFGDDFIGMLEAKGAKISLYDPLLEGTDISDMKPAPKRSLSEAAEGSDCIVILTANPKFNIANIKNLQPVMRTPMVLIDLARIIEPGEIEKEGFIYRGLGKGAEKK
jgi:nucleotide sugar dehydrogenase